MADDTPAKLTINGAEYELPDVLTIGELVAVEIGLGASITELPPASSMYALGWIAMRRKDPRMTWERYSALSLSQVGEDDAGSSDEEDGEASALPPTTAPAPKRSKSASSK